MTSTSWRVEKREDGTLALGAPREAATLQEASEWLPDGAYTTLRTVGGTGLLLLERHLDRLEETMRLLGHPIRLDRPALRALLCEALRTQHHDARTETRLRLTVDGSDRVGETWISVEPLPLLDPARYREGVAVVTRRMHRDNPRVKHTSFIQASREARALLGDRVNEVLMVGPSGDVLEGLSSNFFGVRDGVIYTAAEGVLPGLTRSLVLDEVRRAAIPLRLEALAADALPTLDEAFLSSTGRGVLPVVEIDGRLVGDGVPGPLTQRIGDRFAARLQREVVQVCDDERM